jgi:ABC-type iron transport system FetAB ATPase subunit
MLVSLTSQNVRSFYKDEKQKEFITAMKRRQTYAAVLQESEGFGDTQKDNSGFPF